MAAQALLDGESADDFQWALECVKEMGEGREPQSIFTDADLGAECAMNTVFPTSDKYRCHSHSLHMHAVTYCAAYSSTAVTRL